MRDTIHTLAKGLFGTLAAGGGVYVSLLPQIEAWLRIVSLLAGIAAATATVVSIILKHRNK